MPRVTPSVLRIVPLLLASIAFFPTAAFAACAPASGQELQQVPAAETALPAPSTPGAQPATSEVAGQEAREVLAALGRLDDADTA